MNKTPTLLVLSFFLFIILGTFLSASTANGQNAMGTTRDSSNQLSAYKITLGVNSENDLSDSSLLKAIRGRLQKFPEVNIAIKANQIVITIQGQLDTGDVRKILETQNEVMFYPCVQKENLIQLIKNSTPDSPTHALTDYIIPVDERLPYFGFFDNKNSQAVRNLLSFTTKKMIGPKHTAILNGRSSSDITFLYLADTSQPIVTTRDIDTCEVTFYNRQMPALQITLNNDAAKKLANFSSDNIDRHLLICINNEVVSAPIIQTAITDGRILLAGFFSLKEFDSMAKNMAWPYPFSVNVISITEN